MTDQEFIEIEVPADLVKPTVRLVGEDGNAFAIMGRVERALRRAGNPPEVIDSYLDQSQAGDYDHLLRVAMAFTEHEDDEDE